MPLPRILLCGDVCGRLAQLFKRVSSVNKSSGSFDFLLCVGQFFPDFTELLDEFMGYVEERSPIPLPLYFIGDYGVGAVKVLSNASKNPANIGFKMDGLKICQNLYWLRGSGKFNLHGLSVVYLSGRRSSSGMLFGHYTQDDVDALCALAEESGIVDLFITNEWPSGAINRAEVSNIPPGTTDLLGSDPTIAELVAEIKPRYHIAGSKGVFYAREPYSNVGAVHVTRFLGLAPVGNKEKQKFLHAISPTPAASMTSSEISAKPPNTTLSPYTETQQTPENATSIQRDKYTSPELQYWRYDTSNKRQRHDTNGCKLCFKYVSSGSCPRATSCSYSHDTDAREQYIRGACFDYINRGACNRGPECNFKHSLQDLNAVASRSKECWFCLSSPEVEAHLICSVGESFYCALAKGPLVDDHVLVLPIEHLPSSISAAEECDIELDRIQNSLKKLFTSQEKDVIFFEWISAHSTHANIQAVPVPKSKSISAKDIFILAAKKLNFKFSMLEDEDVMSKRGRRLLRERHDRNCSFFYVQLPDKTALLHSIKENEKFPFQFGREVLAGLLNRADKADWRNCKVSKDDEIKLGDDFRSRYKDYDPFQ